MDIAGLSQAWLELLRHPAAFLFQSGGLLAVVTCIALLPWSSDRERLLAIIAVLSAWFDGSNAVIQVANEASQSGFEDEVRTALGEIMRAIKAP